MSNFESTAITTSGSSASDGSAPVPAAAAAAAGGGGGITPSASAPTAGVGDSTPLSAEEADDVFSAQPTGDEPSAEEMEDRKDATSSADNLLPKDKLENGLKHVRSHLPHLRASHRCSCLFPRSHLFTFLSLFLDSRRNELNVKSVAQVQHGQAKLLFDPPPDV